MKQREKETDNKARGSDGNYTTRQKRVCLDSLFDLFFLFPRYRQEFKGQMFDICKVLKGNRNISGWVVYSG